MSEVLIADEEAIWQHPDAAQMGALFDQVAAEMQERAEVPIAASERYLTEVDHLNDHRLPNGQHNRLALDAVLDNLVPAVKEAAMPYAVSETYQPYEYKEVNGRLKGVYTWLGKTAVQVAATGYKYHSHEAARARVDVEVEEAVDTEESLRSGYVKVFLSPKMTKADAPHAVAKSEHLADDDAVRIGWVDSNEDGIQGKYLQSLLVRDIPLSAWVGMLRDPNNLFGKSIEVENEQSALSVMKVHEQLELPAHKLPEGVVTLVEAVVPYISDEAAQQKVLRQVVLFRTGQAELHQKAEDIALRWRHFEVALADSLYYGYATPRVERFIHQLKDEWNDDFLKLLGQRTDANGIRMDRTLAAKVEEARQNTLWTTAAVLTGNEDVLKQMSPDVARRIRDNEALIQTMRNENYDMDAIAHMEADNNRLIAQQNISVGRGCPGEVEAAFRKAAEEAAYNQNNTEKDDSEKKWMSCPFCKARVFDDPCAKRLECWDCKALVVDGKVKDTGDGGYKQRSAESVEKWQAEMDAIGKEVDALFSDADVAQIEQQEQAVQNVGQLAVATEV